jgi:glycosyltransferase involved in cell wall biosynthesis
MRYIWDQARSYFRGQTYYAAQPVIRYLRRWDVRGAQNVTHFVAISSFVAARIRRFYGRKAVVIPPPVRMQSEVTQGLSAAEELLFASATEPFFLCAGALVPYKRIDVAVKAFNQLGLPLWVVGSGPELEELKRIAEPNVRFVGAVRDAVLWECYRKCRALVFPGIEDFGIVPVEVLSCGRPVIAVDAGGVGESVLGFRPWMGRRLVDKQECGVFIPKRDFGDADSLASAVRCFCEVESQFHVGASIRRATEFSYSNFYSAWAAFAQSVAVYPGRSADLAASASGLRAQGNQGIDEAC